MVSQAMMIRCLLHSGRRGSGPAACCEGPVRRGARKPGSYQPKSRPFNPRMKKGASQIRWGGGMML